MDLVRAIACLLIVNYHTKKLALPVFEKAAVGGFVMNVVFIGLSGFLLAKKPVRLEMADWYRRRLKRIFVPFWLACTVIAILAAAIGMAPDFRTLPVYLTGLHYFLGVETLGIHLWFVSVLLVCYAIFPIAGRATKSCLAAVAALTVLLALVRGDGGIYTRISNEPALRTCFHLAVFLAGMCAAQLNVRIHSVIAPAVFAVLGPAYVIALRYDNLLTVLIALGCALVFILSFHRTVPKVILPPVIFLAGISYEIYLMHFILIDAAEFLRLGFAALPFVFGGTIFLAWVLNRVSARLQTTHPAQ